MVILNHSQEKRIFLIGYRGSGKSTVARMLAERLGWDWRDADLVLEEKYATTIRDIFAEEGEAGFREKEARVLDDLCLMNRCVIATGGGVILQEGNRVKLRSAGKVIWLTASPRTLWDRLHRDPSTAQRRPNLTQGGLAEIEELLRIREPLYAACADLVIETDFRSPEEVVDLLLSGRDLDHGTILDLP